MSLSTKELAKVIGNLSGRQENILAAIGEGWECAISPLGICRMGYADQTMQPSRKVMRSLEKTGLIESYGVWNSVLKGTNYKLTEAGKQIYDELFAIEGIRKVAKNKRPATVDTTPATPEDD